MKRIAVGILAHVDSGKTTLSEAMLYCTGNIRKLGRVDHKDSFLDNDAIERQRGITIFSKIATMSYNESCFTLLDTPGHVDFSSEMERTLSVIDYAIVVISGTDGIQSHTETLWKLLKSYNIPTFVFVNKMDLQFKTKHQIMQELINKFGIGCIDFSVDDTDAFKESLAMCDENIMEEYLDGDVTKGSICGAISARKIFPCMFGSALKNAGVNEFLHIVDKYTVAKSVGENFGAKVYKISEDDKGNRLTHIKITSGKLKVKTEILGSTDGENWSEKINEIRVYSGEKYNCVQVAEQGMVCALTGLSKTICGMGLGIEKDSKNLTLEPVFSYKVVLPQGVSASAAFLTLKKLNEEDTKLNVVWDSHLGEIHMQLMGEVQIEVIKQVIKRRFDMDVEFEQGGIVYKETIEDVVEGVGHYEPLRHYAEVHLIMEPGPRGSGLVFKSKCRDDKLDINWQRLIMTHLTEKTHYGVLTLSPITDMVITLASGKAHQKHTDGGDFRQATYRAVRHGLRNAKSILLEPWYNFTITVPSDCVGRVMTDISNMGGEFSTDSNDGDICTISGCAPVANIRDYQMEIISFSKGRGRVSFTFKGYEPCRNTDAVIEQIGYDCDSDVDNTADSVFCSHGTSMIVKWQDVYNYMHLESELNKNSTSVDENVVKKPSFDIANVGDDELNKIFEMTYGKPKQKSYIPRTKLPTASHVKPQSKNNIKANKVHSTKPEYILVDGYNIIFAWDSLSKLAKQNIDLARTMLINRLINYRAVKGCELLIVFDAYKVKGNIGSVNEHSGVKVVYTKEAETADSYIEKASHRLAGQYTVRVATSDGLEQMIILGNGALRIPASAFEKEVKDVEQAISDFLKNQR